MPRTGVLAVSTWDWLHDHAGHPQCQEDVDGFAGWCRVRCSCGGVLVTTLRLLTSLTIGKDLPDD